MVKKVVLLIFFIMFIFCMTAIESKKQEYLEAEEEYEGIVNTDAVAWICVDGTNINYPVMQWTDNLYYVTHTASGTENKSGAIFLDAFNSSDFSDGNSIIYGHNLQNGNMFSDLKKFLDVSYAKEHDEFAIYVNNVKNYYKVFAVARVDKKNDIYLNKRFNDDTSFKEFIASIEAQSLYKCNLPNYVRNIVTLSTCTNVYKDERVAVIGYFDRVG